VPEPDWERDDDTFAALRVELDEYFRGVRTCFDLELDPEGTPFQRRVWQALVEIPFAQTRSYGALARSLGIPGAARAVGRANGRNPIAIVIPCHRVIASDGSLAGYAGGVAVKRWLLEHEGSNRPTARNTRWLHAAGTDRLQLG
jgi:methylated-DNA-[protein]-cysteine S-methyltransferase